MGHYLLVLLSLSLLQGCYTLKQGIGQVKLLASREKIQKVIDEKLESGERLQKLKAVPGILDFAEKEVGVSVGGSYQKYVKLNDDSVTFVLQVAEKRRLQRKTWWFPIVGSQPYLGFFQKADALKEREKWIKKEFDTSLGGVEAFSLLGYLDDPLYSSMLDNNSVLELAETLIHECLHRTVYVAGESEFNENLAEFVGRQGAILLAEKWQKDTKNSIEIQNELFKYQEKYLMNTAAQKRFQEFIPIARNFLEEFYTRADKNSKNFEQRLESNEEFLKERQLRFVELRKIYLRFMDGSEKGTYYENRFLPERFNNAVFLGYTLYEAHHAPFENLLKRVGGNLKLFVSKTKECFENSENTSKRTREKFKTTTEWAYEIIQKCGVSQ